MCTAVASREGAKGPAASAHVAAEQTRPGQALVRCWCQHQQSGSEVASAAVRSWEAAWEEGGYWGREREGKGIGPGQTRGVQAQMEHGGQIMCSGGSQHNGE